LTSNTPPILSFCLNVFFSVLEYCIGAGDSSAGHSNRSIVNRYKGFEIVDMIDSRRSLAFPKASSLAFSKIAFSSLSISSLIN